MAGDAVVQFQEGLSQEIPFGVAEKFHIGAGLAAAEHGAKGDYQDVVAGMAAGVAGAGASRALNRSANSVMAASPLLQFRSAPGGVGHYRTEHHNFPICDSLGLGAAEGILAAPLPHAATAIC